TTTTTTPLGDLSGNGKTDAADLVLLTKYLLGAEKFSAEQYAIADLDGDGKVNTFDLITLRELISA
ncbi:MAG: dockerin type I repeat-containing protein, partial [Ruminococcus sp.]|nr:dockerin type I repeat-containing protein [Ruminococcus sp.]